MAELPRRGKERRRRPRGTPTWGEAAPGPQCRLGLRGRIHRRSADPHKGDGFFPLPAVLPGGGLRGRLSRGVAQRHARRRAVDDQVYETVQAVNSMAGFDTPVLSSDFLKKVFGASGGGGVASRPLARGSIKTASQWDCGTAGPGLGGRELGQCF